LIYRTTVEHRQLCRRIRLVFEKPLPGGSN